VRKLLVPMVIAGLLGPVAAPALAITRVKVGDNYFVRERGVPTIKVDRGTRVRWVWRGSSVHNVKVAAGPARFGSAIKTSGTYTKRVRKAGTYTLICTVHGPADQSMKLVVR
jgi:hypothetical protein